MQTICTLLQTDNHTVTSSVNIYRSDVFPGDQPTVSKHWRPVVIPAKIEIYCGKCWCNYLSGISSLCPCVCVCSKAGAVGLWHQEAADRMRCWRRQGTMMTYTAAATDAVRSHCPFSDITRSCYFSYFSKVVIGWAERLLTELFGVDWDVKPSPTCLSHWRPLTVSWYMTL